MTANADRSRKINLQLDGKKEMISRFFLLVLQKWPAAEPIAATELRPGRSVKHHKNS